MTIPRLNRLTGLRWWQHIKPRDDTPETVRRQESEISQRLGSTESCAMGKMGTTELLALEFFHRWVHLPWPASASWRRPAQRLYDCSGLFPVRRDIFYRWFEEYSSSLTSLDIVARWQPGQVFEGVLEKKLIDLYCPSAFQAGRNFVRILAPKASWLDDLVKLRWLVIHPFEKTILAQLPRLAALGVFSESHLSELGKRSTDTTTIACPQFAYMVPPRYRDWFEALEKMKGEISRHTAAFDIALVGAGAWSIPLVAHAKRLGKKGMHLGGALQLLFGVKGGRYDSWGIYNSAWTRPLREEVPTNFLRMEQGAYW